MGLRGALERVDGQVEQDLDEIGAVDLHDHVLGKRADLELVVAQARMNAKQLAQIGQELVDPDARGLLRLAPQEAQVAARNLDAVGDLARDDLEPLLDELQVFHREAGWSRQSAG